MGVRTCQNCGYTPVAHDAICCPKCGSREPHLNSKKSLIYAALFLAPGVPLLLGLVGTGNASIIGLGLTSVGVGWLYKAWRS